MVHPDKALSEVGDSHTPVCILFSLPPIPHPRSGIKVTSGGWEDSPTVKALPCIVLDPDSSQPLHVVPEHCQD